MDSSLTVACVCVGNKYPFSDVVKLKNMVSRYLSRPYTFICLTDSPKTLNNHVIETVDINETGLKGWWAKMNLFNRAKMPGGRILYFDLDTVIAGDIEPLANWSGPFGICGSFTRAAGFKNWPCKYGSCVMSLSPTFGQMIWDRFYFDRHIIMKMCKYGDQQAIENIYPDADILQEEMPAGFFQSYRNIGLVRRDDVKVVNFGGNNKPRNCKIPWVQEAWQ